MRTILLIAFTLLSLISMANKVELFEGEPRIPGYTDDKGKQAYWTIFGKDMPEKNYPPTGIIEEGNYKDNRKVGEWIFYHQDGKTPRLIGNFEGGRPNGPYKKFSESGKLIETGSYNNGKMSGLQETYYETGILKMSKNFNAEGKEQGTCTFYYENGEVEYTYNKENGVTVGEAVRKNEDGSIREIKVYSNTGEVLSTEIKQEKQVETVSAGTGGPSGAKGEMKGATFKPNDYNKVYTDDDELWMDGKFKDGKLWDGKLYKYDSDGILLKIEIWKNGAYHSDGHL